MEEILKTNPHIRFKTCSSLCFLYDLEHKKVFTLSEETFEILSFLREEHTYPALLEHLTQTFNTTQSVSFEDNLKSIINDLTNKGIILKKNKNSNKRNQTEQLIIQAHIQEKTPLNVLIELTYRCNEKCLHCYARDCTGNEDKAELSTEEVKKLLDSLLELGVFEITFSGGDIFVRKDAIDILKYATELGFVIDIFTNGLALTDDMIFAIADLYPRSIHFSFYSPIPKTHDKITQVAGSFDRTLSIAKKFIRLSVPVNIKTVVMKENSNTLDQLMHLANSIGASLQIGTSVSAKNDGNKAPIILRETSLTAMTEVYKCFYNNIESCVDYTAKREIDATICGAGIISFSINPYGIVYPCTALPIPIGNIRQKNIQEIWEHSSALKNWRNNKFYQIEGCQSCELMDYCSFCPGTAMLETGSPIKKYEEACLLSQAKFLALKNTKRR